MRILIFAWVVVFVACILHTTHAGETKRKKLVLVVPEKVRHIHHHHVKKIYIKSKPHYYSFEDGLHREDSAASLEEDDIGAIKIKSHHQKRHSGSRHEHKEESKKVVVHSEEIPDSSDWHEEKSTEMRHTHSDHASAASILSKLTSKPTKSSSESSSEEEQRTIVFLDNDAMTESPRGHIKTVHHHHHHHKGREKSPPPEPRPNPEARPQEQRPQPSESRPQNIINHAPERPPNRPPHLQEPRPQNHNHEPNRPPNLIKHEPNRPHVHINHGKPPPRAKPFHNEKKPGRNSTFIENLVPPPVNQQTFTRVVHGSTGYSHGQPGNHPPNQNHPPGRPSPPAKTINGPVPQNAPNRAAPGNHAAKSFIHNHNHQLHSWRKR